MFSLQPRTDYVAAHPGEARKSETGEEDKGSASVLSASRRSDLLASIKSRSSTLAPFLKAASVRTGTPFGSSGSRSSASSARSSVRSFSPNEEEEE